MDEESNVIRRLLQQCMTVLTQFGIRHSELIVQFKYH